MIKRIMLVVALASVAFAQDDDVPANRKPVEVYFARLKYPGIYGDDNLKNWYTDFPEADKHIARMINRITDIHMNVAVVPLDRSVFRYPLLYIVEPEQMKLSSANVILLREYLSRGGTLFLDDFHGEEDMIPVTETLARIWPGIVRIELKMDHDLFHNFFNITKMEQVVNDSIASCRPVGCEQWENGSSGREPHVYAYYAKDGVDPMIIATFNEDLGDGVEWADDPAYPHELSAFSFKMFSNVMLYSLTH